MRAQQQQQSQSHSPTYTTIPISPADVISRSFHNLSAAASRRRPWPEFIATSALDRPHSLSDTFHRLRTNANRFRVNYAFLVSACAAISLVGAPFSLIVAAAILALWLLLYFFREDPLLLWGHHLGDTPVLLALVLLSIAVLCLTDVATNLLIGAAIGIALCVVHAFLINPEGFFLDEHEAASANLLHTPTSA